MLCSGRKLIQPSTVLEASKMRSLGPAVSIWNRETEAHSRYFITVTTGNKWHHCGPRPGLSKSKVVPTGLEPSRLHALRRPPQPSVLYGAGCVYAVPPTRHRALLQTPLYLYPRCWCPQGSPTSPPWASAHTCFPLSFSVMSSRVGGRCDVQKCHQPQNDSVEV